MALNNILSHLALYDELLRRLTGGVMYQKMVLGYCSLYKTNPY